MQALTKWLTEKALKSQHAAKVLGTAPAVAGAGEVFLAIGSKPEAVVYAASRHAGSSVRVGFAAKSRWLNEEVEEAVEGAGGDMTEFLEDEMEADDAIEYRVQHFHEAGWFHFASDIAKNPEFFDTEEGRALVWYYLDGYARAILPIVEDDGEE